MPCQSLKRMTYCAENKFGFFHNLQSTKRLERESGVLWFSGDECDKPDQAKDWEWIHRDCGREWVSVCGIEQSNVLVSLYTLLPKRIVPFKKVHSC